MLGGLQDTLFCRTCNTSGSFVLGACLAVRPSDFLVLDEPSSALDARSEFELFDDLRDRAGDRAILLISHRLSTVRMADQTYVLDGCRVIENGTHDELERAGGHYAEMFELQARKYR